MLLLVWLAALHGVWQLERRTTNRYLDRPLTVAVTAMSGLVADVILPFPVERRGDSVLASGNTAVIVRAGCNGAEALLLMLAGILAVPASSSMRLAALARYLPALFVLNLVRVVGLLFVMVRFPSSIGWMHDQVAQGVMIVAVLLMWMDHLRRLDLSARGQPVSEAA